MKLRASTVTLFFLILGTIGAYSQELNPVTWSFSVDQDGNDVKLLMTAQIDEGWHIYSQFQDYEDGPLPTEFVVNSEEGIKLKKGVKEPENVVTKYDPNFELNLSYFEEEATFIQEATVGEEDVTVTGTLMFMTCNGSMCLAPEYVDMIFEVKGK